MSKIKAKTKLNKHRIKINNKNKNKGKTNDKNVKNVSKFKDENEVNFKSKPKPKFKSNLKKQFKSKSIVKKRVKFNLNDKKKKKESEEESSDSSEDEKSDNESDTGSDTELNAIVDHKKSLESLKEKDKDFYEYLKQNDRQLLDFDVSDEDLDEDIDADKEVDETEPIEKVSIKQIDEWSRLLNEKSEVGTIKSVVKLFRKAVNESSGESSGQPMSTDMFNAIVNVCLIDLLPAIHKFLRLPQIGSNEWSNDMKAMDPTKSRHWKKLLSIMKCYLTDVIKMVGTVSEPSLKSTLLRHILHLIPFINTFPHLIKRVLKETIVLWTESDDKNRILSFVCILRLVRTQDQSMISFILKKLYISYIKNSKFTTEANWPQINFMKHSLVELYSLDQTVAYQHSFVFIRQLAINLRTAMTVKKKESYKCVYNWQFLHSVLLWTQLLSSQHSAQELKPLVCPLVNVIIGTIRLIPSTKFFPMRFHLIKALIKLSEETNVFIPILPLITQVFDHFDKIKKNKSNEEKELNFELLIKVSKLNSSQFEFRKASINKVYDLILYYLSTQSHRIAFPELVQISIIKIRQFVKRSHVVQHNQLLKQLLEKIEENCHLINEKRRNVDFAITDKLAINSWESELRCEGTPLNRFYNQRKQMKSEKEISETVLETQPNDETKGLTPDLTDDTIDDKTNDKTVGKKRKLDESKSKSIAKKGQKPKRIRKNKNQLSNGNTKKTDVFELNQTLDISSDESE